MSSPETERFEMTENDYDYAKNPFSRKKLSKQKQLYGIWAESSGSEGEERGGFGFAIKPKKHRKNFTAPVSFESGGVFQAGGDKDKEKDKGKEPEKDKKGAIRANGTKTDAKADASGDESQSDSESEPKMAMLAARRYTKPKAQQSSTLRPVVEKVTRFGEWEKHTAGIGMRLLMNMGYEPGKGLGKHGQGIVNPVEAVKRTGRETIGFHGTERHDQDLYSVDRQRTLIDKFETKDAFKKRKGDLDTKQDAEAARKPRRVQTAKELVRRTKANATTPAAQKPTPVANYSELTRVKVIDFRGPEQRVYSDYGELARAGYNRSGEEPDTTVSVGEIDALRRHNFDLKPLCANMNRLVQLTEREIVFTNNQCDAQRDQLAALQCEYEEADQRCEMAEKREKRLRELVRILDRFEAEMRTDGDGLNATTNQPPPPKDRDGDDWSIEKCLAYLETELSTNRSADLLTSTEMNELVVALCHVVARRLFNRTNWTPLLDPTRGMAELCRLRRLIQQCAGTSSEDASLSLVWQHLVPALNDLIANYNVRNPDSLVALLETWCKPCAAMGGETPLPSVAIDYVLLRIVVPRLARELDSWSPTTATDLTIHSWFFTWLPLLADRSDSLLSVVRQKLGIYIQSNWRNTDMSLLDVLRNWRKLFVRSEMQAFLAKYVLPRLQAQLESVIVDPGNQQLEPIKCFLAWSASSGSDDEPLFSPSTLVHLAERFFFSKWLAVLNVWLSSPNVDYDEVTRWYLGWKSVFPPTWQQLPAIKDAFARALTLMNNAVQGPAMAPAIPVLLSNLPPKNFGQPSVPPPNMMPMPGTAPQLASFRDLVDQRAQELGILFAPLVGRFQDGKQVYRLGDLQMFVDRHVPFVLQQGRWMPVELDELFRLAVMRGPPRWR